MGDFLFGDSFDHYATNDLGAVYTGATIPGAYIEAVGRNGTNGVRLDSGAGDRYIYKLFSSNYPTLVLGAAFKIAWTATSPFLYLRDGGTTHVDLRLDGSGNLTITRDGALLETSSFVYTAGAWFHGQVKVTIGDGTSGAWELRVNNVTVAKDVGGGDTRNGAGAYINNFVIMQTAAWNQTYVDDLWVHSSDFLGDIRGVSRFANADGTYTDFTASSGDRHDCINKTTPTADAKYVTSLTPGHKVTFSFPAMGKTGNVKAVVNHVWANKSDAGSRVIKPLMISGATESAGANASLSDTALYLPPDIRMVDPATGVAWANIAAVDATQVGVEMVS